MSTDIKFLQRVVAKLWDILDNIDNYAELNINDTDENNPFRNICRKTSERFKYVRSDGYNLFIDDECIDDKGMVKVFCTPKGYTDKLATEVSIRGTKIYPPKGMLIGKVTPIDNSFFMEFVGNDEELTTSEAIEDENIDTFIKYLTEQQKYMHSEKCKERCKKLIKQMKMTKIISEIEKLKNDEA